MCWGCVPRCYMAHGQKSGQFAGVSSFYPMGSRDQTQVISPCNDRILKTMHWKKTLASSSCAACPQLCIYWLYFGLTISLNEEKEKERMTIYLFNVQVFVYIPHVCKKSMDIRRSSGTRTAESWELLCEWALQSCIRVKCSQLPSHLSSPK